jgi:hypothetical protein
MGLQAVKFLRLAVVALAYLWGATADSFWQSRDSNYNVSISGSAPFQGVADVVASPGLVYSLRAMSAATRGNKLINLCDNAGANCADASSDASTGDIVVTTRGANNCATSDTCVIATWYDLTGSSRCFGVCDSVQATNSARATLTHNCTPTGKFCATFVAASSQFYQPADHFGNPKFTQPFWVSDVAKRTGITTQADVLCSTGSFLVTGFGSGANTWTNFAGSNVSVTASDGTLHAAQSLFNGASSSIYMDGSLTGSLNPGAADFGNTAAFINIGFCFGNHNGTVTEMAVWDGDQSASNSAMNANQHNYWGTP